MAHGARTAVPVARDAVATGPGSAGLLVQDNGPLTKSLHVYIGNYSGSVRYRGIVSTEVVELSISMRYFRDVSVSISRKYRDVLISVSIIF